jgi:hypothetical protein
MDLRRHCLLRQRSDDCDGDLQALERTGSTDGSGGMKKQRGATLIELLMLIWIVVVCTGLGLGIYAVCHFVAKFW